MSGVRVRFAPSPTGALHIGAARTALFNWLHARKTGGTFILRIEDTDLKRSVSDSEIRLLNSLERLGLTWDEGPDKDGGYGPYRQSEKLERYEQVAFDLLKSGDVYQCYCSPGELEKERKAAQAARKPPRYSGKCRYLTGGEREALTKSGIKPTYRFKVEGEEVKFSDGIHGEVCFKTDDIGDFIVVRSDGVASYYLASAVDDLDMEITDVIRGEDHLSNTPKQILLLRALGREAPRYFHLPIILGADGQKLSKRSGSADILDLLDAGYLPESLNTAMAMLGWSKITGARAETLESMVSIFNMTDVSRSPAKYDEARLDNINSKTLKTMPAEALLKFLSPFFESANIPEDSIGKEKFLLVIEAVRDAFGKPQDVVEQIRQFVYSLDPDASAKEIMVQPEFKPVTEALLDALEGLNSIGEGEYKAVIESVSLKTGLKGKKLFQPIRVAVTGAASGPKLADLFSILGADEIKKRLTKSG